MCLTKTLIESVETSYKEREDFWKDSPFRNLTLMTNDERGKWGEKWVTELFEYTQTIQCEWFKDKNTNQEDGIYDIVVLRNGKRIRIEVKTATIGSNGSWQHENIYKAKVWDKLIFVDVDYYAFYLTIIDYSEMVFDCKHPVFNRKPTLRASQDDKYKFDLGKTNLQSGIDNGDTFCYDIVSPDEEGLINFITHKLS